MAWLTTDDVYPYLPQLNQDNEADVALVGSLIASVEKFLAGRLGFDPAGSEKTAIFFQVLIGRRFVIGARVASISGLIIDGRTVDAEDYQLDQEVGIVTLFDLPSQSEHKIEVTYTEGFGGTIPEDLMSAAAQLVALEFARVKTVGIGVKSKVVGDASTVYAEGVPWNIQNIIDNYRVRV